MTTAAEITSVMLSMGSVEQAKVLSRFFKTGRGEYGYGDAFLGIKVPQTRSLVKESRLQVPLPEIEKMLGSKWHEVRLCGFLLLVEEMNAALPTPRRHDSASVALRRTEIAEFYIEHSPQANNWDLVDLSCPKIIGAYLLCPLADGTLPDRAMLDTLAGSSNLWQQRIAVVSTLALIKAGQFSDTFRIVTKLLDHRHDLMHKAMGWMLREVGKKDMAALDGYLEVHYSHMPRTTLRYAIERKDTAERKFWLMRKPQFQENRRL